jgi:hypothetical protein
MTDDLAARLEQIRKFLTDTGLVHPENGTVLLALQEAAARAAAPSGDYVLRLLVAAGHVTQEKIDEATAIAKTVAPAEPKGELSSALFDAAMKLMAKLGHDGAIDASAPEVDALGSALDDLIEGRAADEPKWTPPTDRYWESI